MKLKNAISLSEKRVLFCSDLHYGHANILKMSPETRPFTDVENMNQWIKDNIWGKLKPGDHLFDLGDTFWKTTDKDIENILSNIPDGVKLYKIVGNHDSYGLYNGQSPIKKYYEVISDLLDITVRYSEKDYNISLCHYPLVSWNHKPYGSFMLHGHCHGHLDNYNKSTPDLRVDVGIDGELSQLIGAPMISFEDIYQYFSNKVGDDNFSKYVKSIQYNL